MRRDGQKSLLCRLMIHSWETHRNDEGVRYVTCTRCGRDGDKISLNDTAGFS